MLINFFEKVTETGEMLIMLIMLIVFGTFREGIHKQKGPFWLTWLTFPLFYAHLGEKVAKTGEMLIMLIAFLEKVAKTGEMLIMLIMLIVFGTFREGFHEQKGPFWLTWLTFPPF